MNIVSIGDTHGNTVIDKVLEILNNHDKFIFVGDYVDSFDLNNSTINGNLYDLIELKKSNPKKIILLWGNHDIQYLLGYKNYGCSGYRPEMLEEFYDVFSKNKELFVFSFQIDKYLWTHAGIHRGWYKYRFLPYIKENNLKELSISEQLNLAFEERFATLFDVGHRRGGHYDVGGPLWCDRSELYKKSLEGYHQIVGHSRVEDIATSYSHNDTSVTFIDVLEQHIEHYGELKYSSFHYLRL